MGILYPKSLPRRCNCPSIFIEASAGKSQDRLCLFEIQIASFTRERLIKGSNNRIKPNFKHSLNTLSQNTHPQHQVQRHNGKFHALHDTHHLHHRTPIIGRYRSALRQDTTRTSRWHILAICHHRPLCHDVRWHQCHFVPPFGQHWRRTPGWYCLHRPHCGPLCPRNSISEIRTTTAPRPSRTYTCVPRIVQQCVRYTGRFRNRYENPVEYLVGLANGRLEHTPLLGRRAAPAQPGRRTDGFQMKWRGVRWELRGYILA